MVPPNTKVTASPLLFFALVELAIAATGGVFVFFDGVLSTALLRFCIFLFTAIFEGGHELGIERSTKGSLLFYLVHEHVRSKCKAKFLYRSVSSQQPKDPSPSILRLRVEPGIIIHNYLSITSWMNILFMSCSVKSRYIERWDKLKRGMLTAAMKGIASACQLVSQFCLLCPVPAVFYIQ